MLHTSCMMLENMIMKQSVQRVDLLLLHGGFFYPWTVACGHYSLIIFLLALSPLNCTCFLYFLARCCYLALRATPAPMWVLGSLMNLQEACNPYVSEHADGDGDQTSGKDLCCRGSNQNASDRSLLPSSSIYRTLYLFFLLLIFFVPFLSYSPPLFPSPSLCVFLALSLPSRHAEASKLMGNWRTPLLLSDSS